MITMQFFDYKHEMNVEAAHSKKLNEMQNIHREAVGLEVENR